MHLILAHILRHVPKQVIDGLTFLPPVAASEKIAEQSQVLTQDPVSVMLRSAVTTVSADFDPACYVACCIIGDSSEANFRIFGSAWEKIEYQERSRQAPLSTHLFRKVRHSEARCPVLIQGKCACIFPDDWICG